MSVLHKTYGKTLALYSCPVCERMLSPGSKPLVQSNIQLGSSWQDDYCLLTPMAVSSIIIVMILTHCETG